VTIYNHVPGHSLLDYSYLFNYVRLRLNLAVLWPNRAESAATNHFAQDHLAAVLFREIARHCAEQQLPLAVLLFDLDPARASLVRANVEGERVTILNLGSLSAMHPSYYYPRDGHWNAQGHRHVAEQLAAKLREIMGSE
jgi:hypothetical protein